MGCCALSADSLLPPHQQWDSHPVRLTYEPLGRDLGAGTFSQVVLARHRTTHELVALKVCYLDGPEVDDDHLKVMLREAELLALLQHPNIVACREAVRDHKQMVLVLEWLRGGQVIDKLHELGPQYSEQTACDIFTQVAEAVAFMHKRQVLHRDIKPENVMLLEPPAPAGGMPTPVGLTVAQLQQRAAAARASRAKEGAAGDVSGSTVPRVKLIDLGMACYYDPEHPVHGALGSAGFVAPEVVKGEAHTPAMDVFSMGVFLFVLLVGRKPFSIAQTRDLGYAFLRLADAPGFQDQRWRALSPDAKDLLMGMLAYDPGRRLTAEQVLRHEWVTSRGGRLPRLLDERVVFGAATVASVRRLKHLCGGVVSLRRAAEATAAAEAAAAGVGAASGMGRDGSARSASRRGGLRGDYSARDAYLHHQRLAAKRDASVAGEGPMAKLARHLAGKSYARLHDAGGAVHPADDISMHFRTSGAESCHSASRGHGRAGAGADASASASRPGGPPPPWVERSVAGAGSVSGRWRLARAVAPAALRRNATTVMLSEMDRSGASAGQAGWDRSENPSVRGGEQRSAGASASLRLQGLGGSGGGRPVGVDSAHHPEGVMGASPSASVSTSESGASRTDACALPPAGPAATPGLVGGLPRRPSAMQLLAAAAKSYLDGSIHGSRHSARSSTKGSAADLQALLGAAAGNGGNTAAPAPAPPAASLLAVAPEPGSASGSRRSTALPPGTPADRSFGSIASADPSDRPLRVVKRASLDNPLLPGLPGGSPSSAGGAPSFSWGEMQDQLARHTPRSSLGASREGSRDPGSATRRVNVLRPLQ